MRRGTGWLAVRTAFVGSRGATDVTARTRHRLRPWALAFVAGFPGAIGATALVAAFSRSGTNDGAFGLGVGLVGLAALLLVLGLESAISVRSDRLTVRFFGIRPTTVEYREAASATFGMVFPSISYAIALTDRSGARALLHANWWQDERAIVVPVCRALVDFDVAMDRSTARICSQVLGTKRPKARITHHALLRRDRTS